MEELQKDVFRELFRDCHLWFYFTMYSGCLEAMVGQWDSSSVHMLLSMETLHEIGSLFCNLHGM